MEMPTTLPLEMLLLLHQITQLHKMVIFLSMLEKVTMTNMSLFLKKRRIFFLLEMVSTKQSSQGTIVSLMVGQLSIPPRSVIILLFLKNTDISE